MLRKYAQAYIVGISHCSAGKCSNCGNCQMAQFRDAIHNGGAAERLVKLAADTRRLTKVDPDYAYIRVRAIGCAEVDGPNANADFFPYGEFVDPRPGFGYKSFEGKNVFVEHQSSDVRNSIGFIVASYLNAFKHPEKYATADWRDLDSDARHEILHTAGQTDGSIELLNAIDRQREPTIVRKIEKGEPVATSMGTNVEYSVCSCCGNRANNETEYCSCVKYSKGGIKLIPATQARALVKNGSLRPEWLPWVFKREADRDEIVNGSGSRMVTASVVEINYGLQFFEDSIVANPAYTRGYMLERVATQQRPFAAVPTETLQQLYKELR
jgi:hypothetical protein